MAATESTMLSLGTHAPEFALPDPAGHVVSLSDVSGKDGLVVAFISNHCPFVKHIRAELADFGREIQGKNLAMVAINANDIENYPADAPERMQDEIDNVGYSFPYLFDASQEVAKAFRAACTPEFYLFDGENKLVYRGRFDGATPGNNEPVSGKELRAAVDALLTRSAPIVDQHPGIGCNIKWKAGNAPDYI